MTNIEAPKRGLYAKGSTSVFLKFILPWSVISFALITKWWHAIPLDGPDKLFWGFPFPFMGEGFHTSMSLQIFVLEMLADFLIYLLFWTLVFWKISPERLMGKWYNFSWKSLWTMAMVMVTGFILLVSVSDPVFRIRRPYPIKIMNTGYKWLWKRTPHPYDPVTFNSNTLAKPR